MEPAPQPKPPDKRSRLVFWLGCTGCLFFLLLVGVGGTMAWLFYHGGPQNPRTQLPAGWRDSVRAASRLPDVLARLAPEPADGPAIADIRDLPSTDTTQRGRSLIVARLSRGLALLPGDEAAIEATRHDTTLDRVAAAARARSYDILPRFADSAGRPPLLRPFGPGLPTGGFRVARAPTGLVLRGEAALRRGDLARARADFTAAAALGRTIVRTEASLFDRQLGLRAIDDGAQGLKRLAVRSRDTLLARNAQAVHEWSRGGSRYFFLYLSPESLVTEAADTSLPRAVRVQALSDATLMSIVTPMTRIVLGPKGSVIRATRALTHGADPVVARVAVIAESTLVRLDALGPVGRYRLVLGKPRR